MPSTDLLNPVTPILGGAALSSANALPVTVISSAAATGITVDSTTITGGTTGRLLYDNAATAGETAGVTWASASVTLALSSVAIRGFLSSASATDIALSRVAAGSLAVGTGAQGNIAGKILASAGAFSGSVSFADTGVWSSTGIAVSAGSTIGFAGRTLLTCTLDSTLLLTNNAGTSFAGIYLGGTSSAFSLLLTNGILSTFRKGDNASDANLAAGALTLSAALTYGGVTFASTAAGSGSLVGGTNPTLSSLIATGTLTYGGVTLASTVTGTGSMVLNSGPTFASVTTVTHTAGGTITYGGVTWGSAVTGTGSNVLAAAPAITGNMTLVSASATGIITVQNGVAASAGGFNIGLQMSSTASFGIMWGALGSAVPTVVATQGALYINTSGSSTATRMYVKASAAGTWTNFTTAA